MAFDSWNRTRRERDMLIATVPGPSRILRPDVPKRNDPSVRRGYVRSNHWSTVGFGSVPFASRSGRLAPPLV